HWPRFLRGLTPPARLVVLRGLTPPARRHTIPGMGILAALLSAVFSTSKDIVSKKLTVKIDGTASAFASFAFALPFYLVVLTVLGLMGYNIFAFSIAFWWLVLARALTDVFAEGMKMYAFG